jgi:hypothetical protein
MLESEFLQQVFLSCECDFSGKNLICKFLLCSGLKPLKHGFIFGRGVLNRFFSYLIRIIQCKIRMFTECDTGDSTTHLLP